MVIRCRCRAEHVRALSTSPATNQTTCSGGWTGITTCTQVPGSGCLLARSVAIPFAASTTAKQGVSQQIPTQVKLPQQHASVRQRHIVQSARASPTSKHTTHAVQHALTYFAVAARPDEVLAVLMLTRPGASLQPSIHPTANHQIDGPGCTTTTASIHWLSSATGPYGAFRWAVVRPAVSN